MTRTSTTTRSRSDKVRLSKLRPRLLVEIQGEPFTAKFIPDPNGLAWRLTSPDGAVFRLRESLFGGACEHPAGVEYSDCPHVRALQAVGLLNPPFEFTSTRASMASRCPALPRPVVRPALRRPTLTPRPPAVPPFRILEPTRRRLLP